MINVLDAFLSQAKLADSDRELIKSKRGLSDAIIDKMRYVSAGEQNNDIVQVLVKLDYEACVRTGLIVEVGSGYKVWNKLTSANIIIPYFDADGHCTLLRPHKFNPKGVSLQVYFTRPKYDPSKITILTEGEFKAAAAESFSYQAAGLPGISSFVGTKGDDKTEGPTKFAQLCESLKDRGISNVCIVFDNEDKSNPELPGYKSDPGKRYDPQFYAYRIAKQLNDVEGFSATIGWIPDKWRDQQGKADIDGMLARGADQSDFVEVVSSALDPDLFIDALDGDERKALESRIARSKDVTRKNPHGGGTELISESNGRYTFVAHDGTLKVASNFLMEYVCTYLDDADQYSHEFMLTNAEGYSNSCILGGRETSDAKRFRAAIASRGKFLWGAKDFVLDALMHKTIPPKLKIVRLISFIGWDEKELCFFFDNCAVSANGDVIEYTPDGTLQINDSYYRMLRNGDRPELHFAHTGAECKIETIREIHTRLRRNFKSKSGKEAHGVTIAYSWFLACALKPWLFNINRTFPILFVFGQKNSGKTRLLQWLMRIFFSERTDTIIGQNSAAFIRNQAAQLSYLPFWLEEFRNDIESQKHLSILRGIYDHSSAGISGAKIGSNKVFYLRSALVISGESEPSDDTGALNQRMQLVEIPPDITGSEFAWLEQQQFMFSGIFVYLLRNREKLVAQIQTVYEQILESYRTKRKLSSRIAINYALIHATAQVLLGVDPESAGASYDFETIRQDEMQDDVVSDMLRSCLAAYSHNNIIDLKPYIDIRYDSPGNRRLPESKLVLVFSLQRCLDYYVEMRNRQRLPAINRKSIRKLLMQKGWVEKDDKIMRVGERVSRMNTVTLEKAPEDILLAAYGAATESMKRELVSIFGGDNGPLAELADPITFQNE